MRPTRLARERSQPRWLAWDPKGRPTLALISANINSWATMQYWVETLEADVAVLQETRVLEEGLAAAVLRPGILAGLACGERWPPATWAAPPPSWSGVAGGSPGCRRPPP